MLDRVEITETADLTLIDTLTNKFLENGIGYIKSQNGQAVQVFKTEDLVGGDLASSLEMFGMCRVTPQPPILRSESPVLTKPFPVDNGKVSHH